MKRSKKLPEVLLAAATLLLVVYTVAVCARPKEPRTLTLEPLPVSAVPAVSAAKGNTLLDLNTATEAELEGLPGVGPVLAQRIVAWREENGRFASREDVLSVSGIGEAKYEAFEPYITY